MMRLIDVTWLDDCLIHRTSHRVLSSLMNVIAGPLESHFSHEFEPYVVCHRPLLTIYIFSRSQCIRTSCRTHYNPNPSIHFPFVHVTLKSSESWNDAVPKRQERRKRTTATCQVSMQWLDYREAANPDWMPTNVFAYTQT